MLVVTPVYVHMGTNFRVAEKSLVRIACGFEADPRLSLASGIFISIHSHSIASSALRYLCLWLAVKQARSVNNWTPIIMISNMSSFKFGRVILCELSWQVLNNHM